MSFEERHARVRACALRYQGVDPDLGVFCHQFTPNGFHDESVQFTGDAGNINRRPVHAMDLVPESAIKTAPMNTYSRFTALGIAPTAEQRERSRSQRPLLQQYP
jgi:hypothetical protein